MSRVMASLTIAYASGKTFKRTDDLGSLRTIAAEAIAHNRTLAFLTVTIGDNVHEYSTVKGAGKWTVTSLKANEDAALNAAMELAQANEDAMNEAFAEYESAVVEDASVKEGELLPL